MGGRADPPRRGRGARQLRRVRGGPARRGRPRDGAGEGGAAAGRAGDRGRRARVRRLRRPAPRRPGALLRAADAAMQQRVRAVLAVQGRRRGPGAQRRDLRRRERRERRLPAGAVRRGLGARRARRRRRDGDHRRGGRRRAARALPAVRRLPAAAGRVRRRVDARCTWAAGTDRRRYAWASCCPEHSTARRSRREPRAAARGRRARVGPWARWPTPSRTRSSWATRSCPGFPRPSVEGHAGRAVLGSIGGVPVAVLQGRAHLYEGGDPEALRAPVRALAGRRRSSPRPDQRRRVAAPGGRARAR